MNANAWQLRVCPMNDWTNKKVTTQYTKCQAIEAGYTIARIFNPISNNNKQTIFNMTMMNSKSKITEKPTKADLMTAMLSAIGSLNHVHALIKRISIIASIMYGQNLTVSMTNDGEITFWIEYADSSIQPTEITLDEIIDKSEAKQS